MYSSKVRSFSAKSYPEKAGNRICGTLDFKIFEAGNLPPDPPRIACAFGGRILPPPPETMTVATPLDKSIVSKQ